MRLVTSLLALAAAAAATPLLSQQEDPERVWLNAVPANVTFVCRGRIPGYYADVDSGCQMYHMCDPQSRRYSYLCPAFTEFSQFYMTCVQHDRVNCSASESFFHMNEMIGRPRTRFHDLRQHDHSKKKDTEGSKASNRVEASEPAGHLLFEFETKMDVPVRKVAGSRAPSAGRASSRRRTGGAGIETATDGTRLPVTRAPPTAPTAHRLFKTLSPPDVTTSTPVTARSPVRSPVHGSVSVSTARRVKPRVRFADIAGTAATTAAPLRASAAAGGVSGPSAPDAASGLVLPQNTYRTFGLPGSFSFGTLISRNSAVESSTSQRPASGAPRSTAAPSSTARTTKAPSVKNTTEPAGRARSSATASATLTRPRATTEASQPSIHSTTTEAPWKLRPRARLTSTVKPSTRPPTTPRSNSQSKSESTPTHPTSKRVTTPAPVTTPSTTRRPTRKQATPTSTTRRTTTTRQTTSKTRTQATESTTRKQTTAKPTTRKTTKPTTQKTTTAKPTVVSSTTQKSTPSTTQPRKRVTQNTSKTTPGASSSTERPSARAHPTTRSRVAAAAPPIPSLLNNELPPSGELEALRLSFTLEPPQLAEKPDGPHEERNMKVRGELITGEMALRKLVVDQLKPVYFPNPSLPLNLLPPLLSEQEADDGRQTTTLTLPVRRQRPDALLQAAAVAFNILPPELASLVPPLLTPPPPLPSNGATPASSAAATSAKTAGDFAEKQKKGRSGLTMKFGKSKTPFRVGGAHGSPKDACYPCMKSFIKDLDRCHPCVIIR